MSQVAQFLNLAAAPIKIKSKVASGRLSCSQLREKIAMEKLASYLIERGGMFQISLYFCLIFILALVG